MHIERLNRQGKQAFDRELYAEKGVGDEEDF